MGTVFRVCAFVYLHDISKANAASINKLDTKCSIMSPGNPLFWGQEVTSRGHEAQQACVGLQYCRWLRM